MRLRVYKCELCGREYPEYVIMCLCGAIDSLVPYYEDLCDYCGNRIATIGVGDAVVCEECYYRDEEDI